MSRSDVACDAAAGDPGAERHRKGPLLGPEFDFGEAPPDLVDRGAGCFGRRIEQNDAELLAAIAADDIDPAQPRRQGMGQRPQHMVTAQVAEAVVDLLEAIEIDKREAHLGPRAPATLQFVAEPVLEPPVIEKAGEAVLLHHRAQRDGALRPHANERHQALGVHRLGDEIVAAELARRKLARRIASRRTRRRWGATGCGAIGG